MGWAEPYVFNPNVKAYAHDIPRDLSMERYLAAFAIKHGKMLHALEAHVEYALYEDYRATLVRKRSVFHSLVVFC